MKKEVIWWFVIAVVVILLGLALKFFVFNKVKGIDYSCTTNEDCLLVRNSCCSCLESKWKSVAINKNSLDKWEEHLRCGMAVCAACEQTPLSAACVNSKCKISG
jgi:hypothetical protein